MKRSEINRLMKEAVEFINEMNFKLPPFAFWSAEEWAKKVMSTMKSATIC